ncbi:DUF551 domain-containing protein [Escherichia coli]
MSTITKEQAQSVSDLKAGYTLCHADVAILNELARIALASLEAEPVGTFRKGPCGYSPSFHEDAMPLYAAPPAPVSVPAAMEIDDDFDSAFEHGKAVGWNAYRAAMLQAEPVSNSDELPLDYLQGHKDGLEWAAQLAEANHPQTGDWLYDDQIDLARAIRKGPDMPTVQGGNSPVTPDGWISCSERMPEIRQTVIGWNGYAVRQCVYTRNEYAKTQKGREPRFETLTGIWHGVTHWMPLPEPPQEVK